MIQVRLLFTGIIIIIAGMILLMFSVASQGSISTGGFILIGPFPIVFGTGQNASILALLSIIIGAIMLILIYMMTRSKGDQNEKSI